MIGGVEVKVFVKAFGVCFHGCPHGIVRRGFDDVIRHTGGVDGEFEPGQGIPQLGQPDSRRHIEINHLVPVADETRGFAPSGAE